MFLSHDRHRLQGWTLALGVHLEPRLARLTGLCLLLETADESETLKNMLFGFLGRQQQHLVTPHRAELESRLGDHLQGGQKEIYVSAAALVETGLAERVFAKVFAQRDADGLVPFASLHPIAPGVFEQDGLLCFASELFRRSLSRHNNLNEAVLSRISALQGKDGLTVKVRLDPDLVALASTYQTPLEFAYWWGPKFSNDLLAIPSGITVHEADDLQRFFSGVSRTEFWWHQQNGLRTLECEEVRDIPTLGIGADRFGCRYVHSIVSPDTQQPMHLDGAVRIYTEEAMLDRLDKNMYEAGRHTQYVKLWRVDGPLDVSQMKELVTHHFRDNELVGEYLGGRDDSDHLRPHTLSPAEDPLYHFVPCNMDPGMGVRVSVSYHERPACDVTGVQIESFDVLRRGDERLQYIESDTFEVVKLLRRQGVEATLPADVVRLAFEDTAVNLAMITHAGDCAALDAERTMQAIATLVDAWVERGDDRVVSFNIGIVYSDRLVRLSCAGHVVDLQLFLKAVGTSMPHDVADVLTWVQGVYAAISESAPQSLDQPQLGKMLQHTGILLFERKWIDPSLYELRLDEEMNAPVVEFAIPRSEEALCGLVRTGQITWAAAHHVKRSRCSRCGTDYLQCDCSKYLDQVCQQMEEAPVLGIFWSNRPADERVHVLRCE